MRGNVLRKNMSGNFYQIDVEGKITFSLYKTLTTFIVMILFYDVTMLLSLLHNAEQRQSAVCILPASLHVPVVPESQ